MVVQNNGAGNVWLSEPKMHQATAALLVRICSDGTKPAIGGHAP